MFPEGTRQTGPVVEELFDGTAYVRRRTGVPIVPGGHRRQRGDDAEGRQVPAAVASSCSWSATRSRRPSRPRAGPRAAQRGGARSPPSCTPTLQGLFDEAQALAGADPTER